MREGSAPNFCPPVEEGVVFTFQDEAGDTVELEFLGLIIHGERNYGFFFPVDEDNPACSSGEILILEVTSVDEEGQPEEFELVTTYENIGLSKPNPAYYAEILARLGVQPEDCLMVGNDVTEDGAAMKIGLNVFFLTDCLINQEQKDISAFPHGSFDDLLAFLREEN